MTFYGSGASTAQYSVCAAVRACVRIGAGNSPLHVTSCLQGKNVTLAWL